MREGLCVTPVFAIVEPSSKVSPIIYVKGFTLSNYSMKRGASPGEKGGLYMSSDTTIWLCVHTKRVIVDC